MLDLRVIGSLLNTRRLSKFWDMPLSADTLDELKESLRCPRCGAGMESVGCGIGCLGISFYSVVPPILVLKCPQCGYEERSWA
jgi:hypothetical protein